MSVSKGEYKGVMQIIATQIEKTNKHWHKVAALGWTAKSKNLNPAFLLKQIVFVDLFTY